MLVGGRTATDRPINDSIEQFTISLWAVLAGVWRLPDMKLTPCTVALSSNLSLETTSRFLEPILSLLESNIAGILGSLLVDQGEVPDTNFRYVQLQQDEIYP